MILSLSFRTVFVKEALSSCLKAEREIQPIIGMTSHNTTSAAMLRNSLLFLGNSDDIYKQIFLANLTDAQYFQNGLPRSIF
jgi:hypothetical protein